MPELLLTIAYGFWLGILTSISPCPLATNIAAISYVSRRVDNPRQVFLAGLLYTIGRTIVYTVLGIILVSSLLSTPYLARMLQKYMNLVLGPLLIIVGVILLELITFGFGKSGLSKAVQDKVNKMGLWGAGFLGIVFALSFCPTSAALFFGSLLPLAMQEGSRFLLPASYGLATGFPVLVFAFLLALGANKVGQVYNKIVSFERWARKITGVIFIVIGIYYCLVYYFRITLF